MAKADKRRSLEAGIAEIDLKITEGYARLAEKFRERSRRASERMECVRDETRRQILLKRFERYGDAAQELDERVAALRGRTR